MYDCPNGSEVNLKDMGKIDQYHKDMHQGDYTCKNMHD